MKKKLRLYAASRELQTEIQRLKSPNSRYKAMIKAMMNLGKFSDIVRLFRKDDNLGIFLDSLYIIDHNETKFYFTNKEKNTPKTKWLSNIFPNYVIAKEEKESQYSLYSTMDGVPSKFGEIYMNGDSLLYLHNNMVYQYYEFIRDDVKMCIKIWTKEKLNQEEKEGLVQQVKKNQPHYLGQYLSFLNDIRALHSFEKIEAMTKEAGKMTEVLTMENGKTSEVDMKKIPNKFQESLKSEIEATLIDKEVPPTYMLEEKPVKGQRAIIGEQPNNHSVYAYQNGTKQKDGDFYIIGNQILNIRVDDKNSKTYSLIEEENILDMIVRNSEENRESESSLIDQIRQQQPTNIIEYLKVFSDIGMLDHNPTYSARSIFQNEVTARVVQEDNDIIIYEIPEEVYESTSRTIDYGAPITPYYQENPESFQFIKKKSS